MRITVSYSTYRRKTIVLAFLVVFLYLTNFVVENNIQSWINSYRGRVGAELDLNYNAQACPIPKLDLYPETVKEFLQRNNHTFYNCDRDFPLLFISTLEGEIVPAKGIEQFTVRGITECCYQVIQRKDRSDSGFEMSEQCHPLSLEKATKIPASHEFILIKCLKFDNKILKELTLDMDMHAFVHLKPEVEMRLKKVEKFDGRDKVNVVVLGLDSVSRMNFLRTMPKSYDFLLNRMKGVDMAGYNKIDDNTFPNIMPMLTSLKAPEKHAGCGDNNPYDNCPLIWKKYAEQGYATSFGEDTSFISIFNFDREGFINQPTDYYLRPFVFAAEGLIGHQDQVSAGNLCFGPRLIFQVLLANMKKFVFQMSRRNRPYFQFTWTTSLTHDYLHAPALGDEHLHDNLKWMDKEGHLNNTVFILMSDHGHRAGFRNTLQGQLEDRLPIMIIAVPEWMREGKYATAYANLVGNRGRLVTTFDLHETLVNILNLKQVENDMIRRRALHLSNKVFLPRGISLFLPVPSDRTCAHAGIEPNYCSCSYFEAIDVGWEAKQAASVAVTTINSIMETYQQCASLQLKNVTIAQRGGNGFRGQKFYMVNFETQPGNGMFEALVKEQNDKWTVSGTISRTNLYRNQSYCVHDSVVKPYCFCNEWERGGTTEKNN